MDVNLPKIANYQAFGEKVKAWAKGEAQLPASLEDFSTQLASANVGATIPGNYKHVKFVQDDEETLVVRLPCKSLLEAAEAKLSRSDAEYSLPAFYERTFGAQPTVGDKLALQAERIGDYSIASCE